MTAKRVIIADTDEEYIVSIQHKFIEEFFGKIDLEIITDKQYFEELFKMPQSVDILIITDELYDNSILKHRIGKVFVLTEKKDVNNLSSEEYYIFKYSNIREIFGKIISASEEVLKAIGNSNKKTEIILVDSANGGAGKTTVALGVCVNLAKSYKNILYINAAGINTFQYILGQSKMIDDRECSFFLDEQSISYKNVEDIIQKDEFDYVLPFSKPLVSLGINSCIYSKIVQVIKDSGKYDVIIIDADNGFDENKVNMMGEADKVIMVLNQDLNSVMATEIMMKSINDIDSDRYIFVCNNFDENKDNAIKDHLRVSSKVENYIGYINDYDRKKCSGIAQETAIKKLSYLII